MVYPIGEPSPKTDNPFSVHPKVSKPQRQEGAAMSDISQGDGWWVASDGKWYAPEQHPDYVAQTPDTPATAPAPGPYA